MSDEMEPDLDQPVTRRELRAELAKLGAELEARLTTSLTAEMTRQTGAMMEYMRTLMGVVDEKYNDLPGA